MSRFRVIFAAAAALLVFCLCDGALAERGWDITEYCAVPVLCPATLQPAKE